MACPDSIRLSRVMSLLWLSLSILAAGWVHLALAWGAFHVNYFDSALFLLQPMYASRGLKPYIDYGFLYPPGPALLFGKVLRLREISQVQIAVSVFNALAVAGCLAVLVRQAKSDRLALSGAALFCVGAIVPMACMSMGADPCPLTLTCLSLLLLFAALRHGGSRSLWLAAAAASSVTTLWRWERVLPAVLVLAFGAFVLWAAAAHFVQDQRRLIFMAQQLWRTTLAGFVGVSAAFALMAGHAIVTGSWAAEREFIFQIPLLILPYRQLPIPYPSGGNMQWVANCLAIILLAISGGFALRTTSSFAHQLKRGVLVVPPLTLLPYSFNRADQMHFLPVTAVLLIVLLAGAAIWHSNAARTVLSIALILVLWPMTPLLRAQANLQGLPVNRGIYASELEHLTSGCSSLIPSDARSLFVGEESYQRYLTNVPILYVANPDLRPATPFISDEPGVQNTCSYGKRIAEDLGHSPRPTAVALDFSANSTEPNLSTKMHTCGKIETELSSQNIKPIGTCVMIGHVFQVAVIR